MPDCIIHPFPGRHVALEWIASLDIPSELDLAERALAALDALRDVVEPLTADLSVVWSDHETRLPRPGEPPATPFWHVRSAALPDGIVADPAYVAAAVTHRAQLDSATLRDWIGTALDQDAGLPNIIPAWAELLVSATCARLDNGAAGPTFTAEGETGAVHAPVLTIDGEPWVCGPVEPAPTEPPIALAFVSEGGRIVLKIHIHWSCWTQPGTPGRRRLDTVIARLRAQGWHQVSADLAP